MQYIQVNAYDKLTSLEKGKKMLKTSTHHRSS